MRKILILSLCVSAILMTSPVHAKTKSGGKDSAVAQRKAGGKDSKSRSGRIGEGRSDLSEKVMISNVAIENFRFVDPSAVAGAGSKIDSVENSEKIVKGANE